MNIDLKFLYKWLLANKISLNCSKTELIIFKKPGEKIDFKFKIKVNGHLVQPSNITSWNFFSKHFKTNLKTLSYNELKNKLQRYMIAKY